MTSPRVVYITNDYPSRTHTFVYREAAELRDQGWSVMIFPLRRSKRVAPPAWLLQSAQSPLLLAAAVLRAGLRSPRRFLTAVRMAVSVRRPRVVATQLYALLKASELCELLRRSGEDTAWLHVHFAARCADVARYACMLSSRMVRYSVTVHAKDIYAPDDKRLLQERLASALLVAAVSEHALTTIRNLGVAPHKSLVVRCGVTPRLLHDVPMRRPRTRPVLVTVARCVEKKGWRTVCESAERLSRAGFRGKWVWIGDGPLLPELTRFVGVRHLGNSVGVLGARPNSEVLSALVGADVFVLPCEQEPSGDMDGIPVVLMEAMLAGVPVITTAVGAIPELVVHEETGLIVPPGNAEAIVREIERLLADQDLSKRLIVGARAVISTRFNGTLEARRLATALITHGAWPTQSEGASEKSPVIEVTATTT